MSHTDQWFSTWFVPQYLCQSGEVHGFPLKITFSNAGFPGGSVGKESGCNAVDLGSTSEWGRSPREGNGDPLQYSCLGNRMDRGAWQATAQGSQRVGHDSAAKPSPKIKCTDLYGKPITLIHSSTW